MKALHILKGRLRELESAKKIVDMQNSQLRLVNPIECIKEAILELETMNNMLISYIGEDVKTLKKLKALENINCESCKHFKKVSKHYEKKICSILNVGDIGGCGDYWESK